MIIARRSKLIIQLVIILIFLYIIKILRIPSGMISGNGNPVLVIIILLMIFIFWFGLSWFKWLRNLQLSRFLKRLILILSVVVMALGVTKTVYDFSNFKTEFIENFEKRHSRPLDTATFEQVTSGINIYTNYLYFNFTTFLTLVSILNIIAIRTRNNDWV